jgi:hypothetical protein
MRQTLKDYGVIFDKVPLLCDNESAIKIAHNPVQHNKTKHIEIRHHFIRDHVNHRDIDLSYVGTNEQLADIFTKPLDEARFRDFVAPRLLLKAELLYICAIPWISR